MYQALFSTVNLIAILAWVVLAFLPRKPLALSAVMYLGVALLCLIYAVLFSLVVSGSVDPSVAMASDTKGGFTSIPAVRALFLSDAGAVIGWTHYLAFDLFVGLWIAKDADAKGYARWVQLPILFATFMAGPIGLLLWLAIRERKARAAARGR